MQQAPGGWAANAAQHALGGVENITIESGYFAATDAQANAHGYLDVSYGLTGALLTHWELRLGAQLEGYYEDGSHAKDDISLLWNDSFIRYRTPDRRITAGPQIVKWGLMDVSSPTDQMAVQNLRRGFINSRSENRLATPAVRWEEFRDHSKLDLLWITRFTPSRLPSKNSMWYPINRHTGRMLGIPYEERLAEFLEASTIDDSNAPKRTGGAGIRLSRYGPDLDWAVTAQRVRTPLPYFEIDPELRPLLPDDISVIDIIDAGEERKTFSAVYPWTTVLGADIGWAQDQSTWRFEAAWLSDAPITTWDFDYTTTPAFLWAIAWEYFPEWADARMLFQLNGHDLFGGPNSLERRSKLGLAGDIEIFGDRQRWRTRLRYLIGINQSESYLNPELTRITHQHGEWYISAHLFNGSAGTGGRLYKNNDLILAGWRRQFK